jgi:hypothetical protein
MPEWIDDSIIDVVPGIEIVTGSKSWKATAFDCLAQAAQKRPAAQRPGR